MSYGKPCCRPCPISRFPGAKHLDELLYAVLNWLEATAGLLTMGKWFPSLAIRYDDNAPTAWRNRFLLRWGTKCTLCEEWFSSKIEYYRHSCPKADPE